VAFNINIYNGHVAFTQIKVYIKQLEGENVPYFSTGSCPPMKFH